MKNKQHAPPNPASSPRIGIFWYYKKKLLTYSLPAAEVEEQSGFVDVDAGHCDVWPTFQKLDQDLKQYEYEELPRGRVLYDSGKGKYKVYTSNATIQAKGFQELILQTFNLPAHGTIFESDLHYEAPESVNWDE